MSPCLSLFSGAVSQSATAVSSPAPALLGQPQVAAPQYIVTTGGVGQGGPVGLQQLLIPVSTGIKQVGNSRGGVGITGLNLHSKWYNWSTCIICKCIQFLHWKMPVNDQGRYVETAMLGSTIQLILAIVNCTNFVVWISICKPTYFLMKGFH